VRFRFNKVTGEVEEFVVDDQDRNLPEAEHDRVAAEVGEIVAASPRIFEVLPFGGAGAAGSTTPATGEPRATGEDERGPAVETAEAPRREGT
jgi:hypothetical protein